jgi:glycosyltransferase involved in cell wall biosynthesis
VRVVVNALSASGSKTGVGHYTAQLLRCLAAQWEDGELEVFPQGWVRQAYALRSWLRAWLQPPRPPTARTAPNPAGPIPAASSRGRLLGRIRSLSQFVQEQHFRRLCARRRYDLYHEPNFLPLPTDVPTVLSIHDLSVLLHPEWHPADRVAHYTRDFERGLRQCVHVLTGAEFIRQQILDHLGLKPERVTVTPYGVRPDLCPLPAARVQSELRRLGLPPRYLLYLGTLEPRKNLLMLLRVYTSLPEETRTAFPLLLVGNWGWNTADLADYYETEARHRGVLHLGYLADEDLAAVYNGARALVFPSFYEGFGLPPLEMLACGGAVLASTAGAVAETVGAQAFLLDPGDEDGWRRALQRITMDDDWWRQLRQGAVQAAAPWTWERCADATLAVYRQVGDRTSAGRPLRRAG